MGHNVGMMSPDKRVAPDREPLLVAETLNRRAVPSGAWLLRDVSITVDPGELIVIKGPSGSGKTLCLRALAWLDPVDSGAVRWRGKVVSGGNVPFFRSKVVYLQQRASVGEDSVEDILRQPFHLQVHRGRSFDRERVVVELESLGRDAGFLNKAGRDLSGGERQIVALLRAMQFEPEILLLDEPTAALDAGVTNQLERLIKDWLVGSDSRAIVWVTHDDDQCRRIASRQLVMRDGRLFTGDAT